MGCRQVTKYVFWTGLFLYAFGPTVTISFGDDDDEEDEEQGQEGGSTTTTNSDAAKNDEDAPEAVLPGSIAMTEGRPFFLPLTFVRERAQQLDDEEMVELDAINKALENQQSIIEIKQHLVQIVATLIHTNRPHMFSRLGDQVHLDQYWLDMEIPNMPPVDHYYSGLEFTRNAIYWTTRTIDPYDLGRIQQAWWPEPVARSLQDAGRVLLGKQWDRVKSVLGRNSRSTKSPFVPPEPMPPDARPNMSAQDGGPTTSASGNMASNSARPDLPRDAATAHKKNHAPSGVSSDRAQQHDPPGNAPAVPSPSDDAASDPGYGQQKDSSKETASGKHVQREGPVPDSRNSNSDATVTSSPTNKNSRSIPSSKDLINLVRGDHISARSTFFSSLSQRWKPIRIPPSRSAIDMFGYILFRGEKGSLLVHVRCFFNASDDSYRSVNVKFLQQNLRSR